MKIKTLADFQAYHSLANQLEELVNASFQEGLSWNRKAFFADFQSEYARYYLIEHEDQIIGMVNGHQLFEEFELFLVAVHPDFRGTGLATLLLQTLEEALQSEAVNQILLEVRPSNQQALNLYTKFCFEQYHTRKDYYTQPIEDAWLLRKKVSQKRNE
ncbi:ribosomal protein S18-alanine N-acetyltransferase [Enterococcus camelliae]|uniref:Ribosomal protein S18-alanine N-acetyltransferase n=1 Tax=Enterococcus camelliae TaxID=453959 RepID=A0ABW5TJB8_9ENTE